LSTIGIPGIILMLVLVTLAIFAIVMIKWVVSALGGSAEKQKIMELEKRIEQLEGQRKREESTR
jgi:5-bromo-4-chloroindolyl phosphate hydrolysis protein